MAKEKVLRLRKEVTESWQEVLEQYLWFKQAEGLREATVRGHRDVVRLFHTRYPEAWENPKKAVLAFMAEDIKASTYNIRLSYLKAFFDWCVAEGIHTDNPMTRLKKRKAEGRVVNLTLDDLKALIELPDTKTFAGLRDYAVILLTLDTGIRPKEAFSLLVDDFNFRSSEVYVRSEVAKTKVSRSLPFSPVTAKVVRELIQTRHPGWNSSVPVFCSTEGTTLNRHTWGDRLEMYCKRLGINIRPYDLRHAFALQFLRNGGHALALQRTLGHTDLSMTKRYVALTQQDIKEQHALASPLNVLLPQRNRVRNVKQGP